jgi:hypothetical protein
VILSWEARVRWILAFLLALVACPACSTVVSRESVETLGADSSGVVFAYFTGDGSEGMKLAIGDGRVFKLFQGGRSVLTSRIGAGLVRDPSIVRGPDGKWHAVWTTGWWASGFGIADSADLIHWSPARGVPVMAGVKGTVNTWAPEIHWDPERQEYLVLWASTVRGMFTETEASSEPGPDGKGLNHRIWAATSKDLHTWSAPRVFFDPGFNVIDAVIVRDELLGSRGRWVLVCKDERLTPVRKKNLRVAFADSMQGTYTVAERPIEEAGSWVEGPTVLRDGDGWVVYYDRYRAGEMGAVRTTDWEHFEGVRPAPVLPEGARHGCVVRIAGEGVPGRGGA